MQRPLFEASVAAAELATLGRVAAAMVLGALIGLEREVANRPAGLRTHMLVAGSAALLTSLGVGLIASFESAVGSGALRSDPIRVIQAIVTGVSFLGAGTILRSGRRDVTGLTTAATLLLSASLGICVALSRWMLALGVVLLTLVTLLALRRFERRLRERLERRGRASSGRGTKPA